MAVILSSIIVKDLYREGGLFSLLKEVGVDMDNLKLSKPIHIEEPYTYRIPLQPIAGVFALAARLTKEGDIDIYNSYQYKITIPRSQIIAYVKKT